MAKHARVFTDLTEAEVERLAHILSPLCHKGDVLALSGELGTGKSVFARAFVRTAMGNEVLEVPSPSYTLVQRYRPHAPYPEIWHVDLYRLQADSELSELGLEDALRDGITVIEWPRRAKALLPDTTLEAEFAPGSRKNLRTLTLSGGTPWAERLRKLNIIRR